MEKITISTGHPDAGRVYAEAYDAALEREAALREELALITAAFDELASCVGFSEARLDQTVDSPMDCANQLQQRLAVAEQRNVVLAEALEGMIEYFPEGHSDGECFSVERANLALGRPNDCIHDWFPDYCLKCGATKP